MNTSASIQPISRAAKTRTARVLTAAAVVVYLAGVAVAFVPAWAAAAAPLRWIGLAFYLPVALRRRSLLAWTFWAMLAGVELGADLPHVAAQLRVIGDLFLRLVRMIVAPLIFGALVTGIAGHSELKGVGRIAIKSIIFFEVVTTIGLLLGMVAIHISHAGVGVALPASAGAEIAAHSETWQQMLLNVFPENVAKAVGENQILQVAVFSILFGTALATLPEPKRAPLVKVLQSLTDTMFRLTRFIMVLAPLAAGAAMAYTIGSMGLGSLLSLLKLVVTYYVAMAAFVLLVFVPILHFAGVSLRRFWRAISEPSAIGFATSSSEAALPLAMERMEEIGVPRWIVSFVIPTGYTFNMTGSSLYFTMAAIFAAQAAGIHLSWGQQFVMLITLMLASKGMAGVPRATLVVLMGAAAALHIPSSAILILLGVDTVIDMGRAGLNVVGNCMAAAVVARWEGETLAPAE
ncbi:MAG: dicarboxylate/amino acid:cation symporter [Acidobacteriota bacterium]